MDTKTGKRLFAESQASRKKHPGTVRRWKRAIRVRTQGGQAVRRKPRS